MTNAFTSQGLGKCITSEGADPVYDFIDGIGFTGCKQRCIDDKGCFGFSVSSYDNCLLWLQSDLVGGGDYWGGAECYLRVASSKPILNGEQYCESESMISNQAACLASSCCHWNAWESVSPSNDGKGRCRSSIGQLFCYDTISQNASDAYTESERNISMVSMGIIAIGIAVILFVFVAFYCCYNRRKLEGSTPDQEVWDPVKNHIEPFYPLTPNAPEIQEGETEFQLEESEVDIYIQEGEPGTQYGPGGAEIEEGEGYTETIWATQPATSPSNFSTSSFGLFYNNHE